MWSVQESNVAHRWFDSNVKSVSARRRCLNALLVGQPKPTADFIIRCRLATLSDVVHRQGDGLVAPRDARCIPKDRFCEICRKKKEHHGSRQYQTPIDFQACLLLRYVPLTYTVWCKWDTFLLGA